MENVCMSLHTDEFRWWYFNVKLFLLKLQLVNEFSNTYIIYSALINGELFEQLSGTWNEDM